MVLILGYKNTKYGFSCLKFFVVVVWIPICVRINYLSIWNIIDKTSENGFNQSFIFNCTSKEDKKFTKNDLFVRFMG